MPMASSIAGRASGSGVTLLARYLFAHTRRREDEEHPQHKGDYREYRHGRRSWHAIFSQSVATVVGAGVL
jgi:hypothetical protein